jgi:hypothetical protein
MGVDLGITNLPGGRTHGVGALSVLYYRKKDRVQIELRPPPNGLLYFPDGRHPAGHVLEVVVLIGY